MLNSLDDLEEGDGRGEGLTIQDQKNDILTKCHYRHTIFSGVRLKIVKRRM